jgi:hypothetical protein
MRPLLSPASLLPFFVLLSENIALAQSSDSSAASLLACGSCGAAMLVPIGLFIVSVALLVWVARDAKARGMDSAVGWMLVVFFLNLLGLLIYLFARPQGNTLPCPNCSNKRLQASVKCPHCGIGA